MAFVIKTALQVATIATGAGLATAAIVQLFNPQFPRGAAVALTILSLVLIYAGVSQF